MDSVAEIAPRLSIVIPVYNEELGIAPLLARLLEVMQASDLEYEIIVVDDGSTDNTTARIETAGVHVLRHQDNRGYGAALKTGIRQASNPIIVIMDADGTYLPEYVPCLVEHLVTSGCDMVVGARTGKGVKIPRLRRPAKWAISRLAELVAGQSINDLNSGLRVFRRQVALRLVGLLPDGFSFTTTITMAMLSNEYVVEYLPIDYHARVGRSKISPVRDTLSFVVLVLRIGLYFAPLKIFLPISGILLLSAIGWGVFTKFVLGEVADVSTMVIVMTAVQVGVVGLVAELIDRRLPNLYHDND
jgi:glycosyltransferase involved in cell wall biosynthesis|tara:strand:+ start:437 stop:1342 length:906 start_codon:yes stop_codon:yes gene_type:complete